MMSERRIRFMAICFRLFFQFISVISYEKIYPAILFEPILTEYTNSIIFWLGLPGLPISFNIF